MDETKERGGTDPVIPADLAVAKVPTTAKEVAQFIDHTLLKPEATAAQAETVCREAAEHGFCSVCVNSTWVSLVAGALSGSAVKTCAVVGFPLGAMVTRAKVYETEAVIQDGANEVDMVINVGALKAGDHAMVLKDIRAVRTACSADVILKVIIENALLTQEEKITASRIVLESGADFVKTSTGFSHHGATVEDVMLMRRTVGRELGVKAAGGVRTFEDAVAMIRAGATRIGASSGVQIVTGGEGESSY